MSVPRAAPMRSPSDLPYAPVGTPPPSPLRRPLPSPPPNTGPPPPGAPGPPPTPGRPTGAARKARGGGSRFFRSVRLRTRTTRLWIAALRAGANTKVCRSLCSQRIPLLVLLHMWTTQLSATVLRPTAMTLWQLAANADLAGQGGGSLRCAEPAPHAIVELAVDLGQRKALRVICAQSPAKTPHDSQPLPRPGAQLC